MDIVIGKPRSVHMDRLRKGSGKDRVEARVLKVRSPRRRKGNPPDGNRDRRGEDAFSDPAGGQVMVLLVPDAYALPSDIDSGNYRLFLQILPRRS